MSFYLPYVVTAWVLVVLLVGISLWMILRDTRVRLRDLNLTDYELKAYYRPIKVQEWWGAAVSLILATLGLPASMVLRSIPAGLTLIGLVVACAFVVLLRAAHEVTRTKAQFARDLKLLPRRTSAGM